MSNVRAIGRAAASTPTWPLWPLKAVLVILFLGPLIAPLFQATRLPLVADSGALARDLLSRYVCPTPAKSYVLLGFPMAVCARCWGATIGLWLAWFAFRRLATDGRPPASNMAVGRWAAAHRLLMNYLGLAWPLRFAVSSLPFWLWVAEITRWPGAPYWFLLANGAFAGLWAGLFFCSVWPGLRGGHTAR